MSEQSAHKGFLEARLRPSGLLPVRRPPRASRRLLLATGAALALGTLVRRPGEIQAGPLACGVPPREPAPFAPPDPASRWTATPGPTVTTVTRSADANRYQYRVDNRGETIRGMGYNPPAVELRPGDRRQRLERDLSLMVAAGVNTLIGWNPAVIDGLTLDVAQQVGLGMAVPFDVDFTLDVRDSGIRQAFIASVLGWVEQYRDHPAVRMWAIGNEVLQRSVPPVWCSTPPSESQGAWADAWASLLVEVADLVHAHDPYHPVLYREAEDSYAPWLARALAARPGEREWLVYGVNAYTPRLAEILDGWPDRGFATSLFVSEYAPSLDAPRVERAQQFRELWGIIRARDTHVLGGAVYVWSTDGPEEVDRAFGLVDAVGEPVDDALETIAALYHQDARNGSALDDRSRMDDSRTAWRAVAATPGSRTRPAHDRVNGRSRPGTVLP
jgi:hypothetical protein